MDKLPESKRADLLLARLSRITTSGLFVSEIDGLRFFAIGLVVWAHVGIWATNVYGSLAFPGAPDLATHNPTGLVHSFVSLFAFGAWGVPLFFIISGFVLGLPFASRHLVGGAPVKLSRYFLRRLTRLEPPYLIALFATFLIVIALPYHASLGALSSSLAWGVPYMANLYGGNAVLGVAWSLEVEVQFYLLVPLLTMVFAIQSTSARRAVLVGAMIVSAIAQHAFLPTYKVPQQSFLNWDQYFLAGFLLVDIYLLEWRGRSPTRRLWTWDLLWLAGGAILVPLEVKFSPTLATPLLGPFLGLILCVAAFKGRTIHRIVSNRWIYTIGGMCYSIYLLHTTVVLLLVKFSRYLISKSGAGPLPGGYLPNLLAILAVLTAGVLLIGTLYFAFVERPFMDRSWPGRLADWLNRPGVRPSGPTLS